MFAAGKFIVQWAWCFGPLPALIIARGVPSVFGLFCCAQTRQVHGVRIKAGNKASYCNRFVRNKQLAAEEKAGKPLALK